jgi:hypothetical protein
MHTAPLAANPFALLTDPEAIFRAVAASQPLDALNRRVCRPLDRHGADGQTPQDAQAGASPGSAMPTLEAVEETGFDSIM